MTVECGSAISVRCPDCPEQPQLSKKLPATMTVQKLKGLLARAYKVSSTDQRLSYLDSRVRLVYTES